MKKCKCDDYLTCNSEQSCMYDFILVEHVAELGTVIIEDLSCNEKVIVCDEHVPQLIEELKHCNNGDIPGSEQWLVTYEIGNDLVKNLFSKEQDAINYKNYIHSTLDENLDVSISKVNVLVVK
ncbi:MAG: hypothetical protein IJ086_03435 [Clostridium sp.]|nr:hypothetical protein [Clostridium sp.]